MKWIADLYVRCWSGGVMLVSSGEVVGRVGAWTAC